MLKSLQKYFKPASAEQQEEVPEMTTKEDQAALVTDDTTAELTAQLATVNEVLTATQSQLAELTTKFEAAQAALNASEAAQAILAKQAADARLEARTKAISEAVGTSQLESLLAATDSMDDTQFNTIIGAMGKSFENEAKSAMFQEAGVANDKPAVEVDAVKQLADKFAAEFKQTK